MNKVLSRFHFNQTYAINTPIKETALLLPRIVGQVTAVEIEQYQDMINFIIFSIIETRPDIAFATSVASQFAKNPGHQHTEMVKIILLYFKDIKERGIIYGGQEELLVEEYSDSDWAGDKKSRKSTSDFIFILNGGPVSWCSKKQATMILLSTKVEYIAFTLTTKEATWLRLLLTELGLLQPD